MIKLLEIRKSRLFPVKRYDAIFQIDNKQKIVPFGSQYENYIIHKDPKKKELYLKRHAKREDWGNPITPGSLSRWILWNKPDFLQSVKDFKNKFNL
jgi:hypothetical protein